LNSKSRTSNSVFAEFAERRDVRGVDNDGALLFHLHDRRVSRLIAAAL